MAPHDPRQEGDGDDRQHHGVVAEHGLARSVGQNIRGDAHGGQDEDVDLRVPEEPEQMLPEQRLPVAGRKEETGPERLVEEQHDQRAGQNRDGQKDQDRGDEERPGGQRQAEPGHPRRAHVDDGRDIVDRARERCEAQNGQADQPELLPQVDAGILPVGAERGVGCPARPGGSSLNRKARKHEQSGGERHPERGHVEAREGHVVRTDLERDEQIAEDPHQQRHDREEDHDGAVHGDQRVVELGQHDGAIGRGCHHFVGEEHAPGHGLARETQLPPDHRREQSPHHEEEEAHEEELGADDFVVARENVTPNPRDVVGGRVRIHHWSS